jgi:two-component system OmpR family sensor kinase
VTVAVAECTGEHAPSATVRVHDDGPGVPPSLQPSVFERFTRADTARTREVGGAGLGLSLARAIARAHEGDLGLDSRPGSTTFTLTLPVTDVRAPEPVAASRSL